MSKNKKEVRDEQISIRMSSEMLHALDKYSKDMGGIQRTNIVRMAIQEWLIKRDKEKAELNK